jgi:hypothetical protein
MVTKIRHLVKVEEVAAEAAPTGAKKSKKKDDTTSADA